MNDPESPDVEHRTNDGNAVVEHDESQAASEFSPPEGIDWESSLVDVLMRVELPFWLLMPDCNLNVTEGNSTLSVGVSSDFAEFQHGPEFRDSHDNTMALQVMSEDLPDNKRQILDRSGRVITRHMKSTLTFQVQIHSSVIAVLDSSEGWSRATSVYLKSLSYGHIPFVNNIINAYRHRADDAFAAEVSEWDVPFWYYEFAEGNLTTSLSRYHSMVEHPGSLISPDSVQAALFARAVPGKIDLLNAWSCHYRGRYGDAVRYLVTSIEVLLAHKLREEHTKRGWNQDRIDAQIASTRMSFKDRLDEYCRLSGRRIPGPVANWVPYLNGLRLEAELDRTRRLRHEIVHEGRRLEHWLRGPMLRASETTTWFFEWLEDSDAEDHQYLERYAHQSAMFSLHTFDVEYRSEGVRVVPPQAESSIPLIDDLLTSQLFESATTKRDIEKCVVMSLTRLGLDAIEDAPVDPVWSEHTCERFIVHHGDGSVQPVFISESQSQVTAEHVHAIAPRILAQEFTAPLLIVDHCSNAPLRTRLSLPGVAEDTAEICLQCGVTVATLSDLLILADAAERYRWPLEPFVAMARTPGRSFIRPPDSTAIGTVRRFFPDLGVISIHLDAGERISRGDRLIVRLAESYGVFTADEMQVSKQVVTDVEGPEVVGVRTAFINKDVIEAREVLRTTLVADVDDDPTLGTQ